jgi:two-component system OmpR family response regulator
MRVLVVEDDEKIASFVIKGLKQSGFSVDHAGDGEAALGCCRDVSYDAIILDIMLQRQTGSACCGRFGRRSAWCRSFC